MSAPSTTRQLIQIAITLAAIALIGIALGLWYSALPGHDMAKNKAACEQSGGVWNEASGTCAVQQPSGSVTP